MNFLNETLEVLKENNKTEQEVLFVKYDGYFSFEKFKEIANIEYDSGFGGQEIPNIEIVGRGWWLERAEYDGSEWWEFKTKPKKPKKLNTNPKI
jgi:hypothetical protein